MDRIHLVYKNSDMTEGNGPMKLVVAFSSWEAAAFYVDWRPGVMGRKEKWSEQTHGDWQIVSGPVFESVDEANHAEMEAIADRAMNQWTPEKREALGLT